MKIFLNVSSVVFLVFATFSVASAQENNCTSAQDRASRTACEVVQYNAGRDTSTGKIGRLADYCDTALRRDGEPLVFRYTRGNNAWAKDSLPLPGLVWAGQNKAGERFRELNIRVWGGQTVVETELCVDLSVWRNALASAGVTREDIARGRVTIFLCGGRWAHRIPHERILAIMNGTPSEGGVYSALSKGETQRVAEILTRRGY